MLRAVRLIPWSEPERHIVLTLNSYPGLQAEFEAIGRRHSFGEFDGLIVERGERQPDNFKFNVGKPGVLAFLPGCGVLMFGPNQESLATPQFRKAVSGEQRP
jgi:hypothetical protein